MLGTSSRSSCSRRQGHSYRKRMATSKVAPAPRGPGQRLRPGDPATPRPAACASGPNSGPAPTPADIPLLASQDRLGSRCPLCAPLAALTPLLCASALTGWHRLSHSKLPGCQLCDLRSGQNGHQSLFAKPANALPCSVLAGSLGVPVSSLSRSDPLALWGPHPLCLPAYLPSSLC